MVKKKSSSEDNMSVLIKEVEEAMKQVESDNEKAKELFFL